MIGDQKLTPEVFFAHPPIATLPLPVFQLFPSFILGHFSAALEQTDSPAQPVTEGPQLVIDLVLQSQGRLVVFLEGHGDSLGGYLPLPHDFHIGDLVFLVLEELPVELLLLLVGEFAFSHEHLLLLQLEPEELDILY